MEVIRQYKLSAAIFAFGWVYEKLGENQFREINEKYKFIYRLELE